MYTYILIRQLLQPTVADYRHVCFKKRYAAMLVQNKYLTGISKKPSHNLCTMRCQVLENNICYIQGIRTHIQSRKIEKDSDRTVLRKYTKTDKSFGIPRKTIFLKTRLSLYIDCS
eukprot:NODE_62_length_25126_cov_0.447277.p11 type:complete len:115 gc:universal NODE_62_length_25126_cov_0.447277:2672-3016(+)